MKHDQKDDVAATSLHLLHRAGQCADELFTLNMGGSDLTPRQFAVLKAIAASDEPSQTLLVAKTGIDRSTMADIMRRLLSKGYVQRRRTRRDARMYAVKLTEKGLSALKLAEPAARLTEERILSALPANQRESFVKGLGRIIDALTDENPAAVR